MESGGTANLEGCNIFDNVAQVRARLLPLPAPSSSAPLERFVCSPSAQSDGGGLAIYGTATLTSTNVYSNRGQVRVLAFRPFPDLSSIAPLN